MVPEVLSIFVPDFGPCSQSQASEFSFSFRHTALLAAGINHHDPLKVMVNDGNVMKINEMYTIQSHGITILPI